MLWNNLPWKLDSLFAWFPTQAFWGCSQPFLKLVTFLTALVLELSQCFYPAQSSQDYSTLEVECAPPEPLMCRVGEDRGARRGAEAGGGEQAVLGCICSLKPNPWSYWPPNVKFTPLPSYPPGTDASLGLASIGSLAASCEVWWKWSPQRCRSTSSTLGQPWKGDWSWQRAYLHVGLFCFCKLLPCHELKTSLSSGAFPRDYSLSLTDNPPRVQCKLWALCDNDVSVMTASVIHGLFW